MGPKTKARVRAPASKKATSEDANTKLTRAMLAAFTGVVPDVTAGFAANVETELKGVQWPGAGARDGAAAGEAHRRLIGFAESMGMRAPEGRSAQWKGWAKALGLVILNKLDFREGGASVPFPRELVADEAGSVTVRNAELRTIFTTPTKTSARADSAMKDPSPDLRELGEALNADRARMEQMTQMHTETLNAITSLVGRVNRLESAPAPAAVVKPVEQSSPQERERPRLNERAGREDLG